MAVKVVSLTRQMEGDYLSVGENILRQKLLHHNITSIRGILETFFTGTTLLKGDRGGGGGGGDGKERMSLKKYLTGLRVRPSGCVREVR